MEKCISFKNMCNIYKEECKKRGGDDVMSVGFNSDELTKLNIFTIIKNEIINVLSVIKKHEYNKNLDSSIVDALFILYNSINNLNKNLKEEIYAHDFSSKLDIYHIAPFLNIIRNNNIFYKIKLSALHSLDHILKYNSSYFNEKINEENVSGKQDSYMSLDNEHDIKSAHSDHKNKKDLTYSNKYKCAKVHDIKKGEMEMQLSKMNEKTPKKKKYNFFSKNYKLSKKMNYKKEENTNFLINKGNNIINISIETLLSAPINYNNVNHEEIILYDTILLFNNILCNAIKVVDRKNIIKIICYIFKIYKNNKYSLLFKGNCESMLKNIFYVVMKNVMNAVMNSNMVSHHLAISPREGSHHDGSHHGSSYHESSIHEESNPINSNSVHKMENSGDDEFIHDILTIILILLNSNKNNFIVDLLKTKEGITLYNDLHENDVSQDNMESINLLSFRLLNILLETCGYSLINKNFDAICNIIRCLFFHITSSSFILMCRSMRTYINIFILYKKHFFIYNEIFINILLNILRKSTSKNVTETTLLTLSYFCLENVLFEIYYNHDVNLYSSDLLENMLQSILELCINFIQNTPIMNEVIFKMVKSILHILEPCIDRSSGEERCIHPYFSSNRNSSNVGCEPKDRLHEIGYTNQLTSQFRSDIYSNAFGYVMNSKIKKRGKSRNKPWGKNCHDEIEDKRDIQKQKCGKKRKVEKSVYTMDSTNESFNSKKEKENESTTNDNKKNNKMGVESTENLSKKSNMNELYSLNFLTSSKDKSYVIFCSILLFERIKDYIKIDYIKKKEHLMRKKKTRKEILKKSAIIFNTLKNKSISELIKMKIIQTEDTLNQFDSNYSIIDSVLVQRNENNVHVYSDATYDEKSCTVKDEDGEKANEERSNQVHSDCNTSSKHDKNDHIENRCNSNLCSNPTYDTKCSEGEKHTDSQNNVTEQSAHKEEEGIGEDGVKEEKCKEATVNRPTTEICENDGIHNEKKECLTNIESSESTNTKYNRGRSIFQDENKDDVKTKEIHHDIHTKREDNVDELLKEDLDRKVENDNREKHNDVNKSDTILADSNFAQTNLKKSSITTDKKNLMEDNYFLKSIAKFLRYNPFLDKEFVGEYISHRKNINILKSYVRLFDFSNLSLLSSLRLFLHSFKLPGEAQLIERILEHFSLCFFYSNPICENLDRVYKIENEKIVPLLKEEELANTKRYILIDFLRSNSHGSGSSGTNVCASGTDSASTNINTDTNTNGNATVGAAQMSSEIHRSSVDTTRRDDMGAHKGRPIDGGQLEGCHVQGNINFKRDEDTNEYIHRNVYLLSKSVQSLNEEEIKKKYVLVENSDVIFILTYSIIMLNTDLHNNQVKNKMKLEEFIKNNRGINNGKNIDRVYLENLYNCILHEEIKLFSNVQNAYTNDNQYWKLIEKRKEQYKNYHLFKAKEVYYYKFDINKLLIKNNFIPIFFSIFKRTNDFNLTENCLCIFKMIINNVTYYHDLDSINRLCYIFKYINFYLTQKSQSLLYLLFHFIKKCHNLFRDGWIVCINVMLKLITIDLVPIFFYPHMYINNTQFNNDKEFLHKKYIRGNCVETYTINKSITDIYNHPFLIFKKNVKKLNKSKWIDEFSNIFFSRNNTSENSNLSIIFKEGYSEKAEEKRNKKREKMHELLSKEKASNPNGACVKQVHDENENENEEKNEKKNENEKEKEKEIEKETENENEKGIKKGIEKGIENENDDEDEDEDEEHNGEDEQEYTDEDNLNHIYVHMKVDPKNVDNNAIIDNVNIYKRIKLDIYNFFTINDFYNNMITNLNINSFIYLIKILMIKSSINKEKELGNVNPSTHKAEMHNANLKVQIPNQSYLSTDKSCGFNNSYDCVNDSNPVLVNSDNSFDLFYYNKQKLLTSQMLFHIMYFKINYTYVLCNMICKMDMKRFKKGKRRNEHHKAVFAGRETESATCGKSTGESKTSESGSSGGGSYSNNRSHSEGEDIERIAKAEEERKRNRYDLTLANIYDTDNSTNVSSSDSEYSDISSDSFYINKCKIITNADKSYSNNDEQEEQHYSEKSELLQDQAEFDKIYAYADDEEDDQGDNTACEEDDGVISTDEEGEEDQEDDRTSGKFDHTQTGYEHTFLSRVTKGKKGIRKDIHSRDLSKSNRVNGKKHILIDQLKMDLYMKTYIMHLKITVITFEHFFNLLNKFLMINYNKTIFVNIYNSIFKRFPMENIKFLTEQEIMSDKWYHIYDENFENIDKKLNYKEEKMDVNNIEKDMFLIKFSVTDSEEDWLFIEQLIMSVMNFSYICLHIYRDDKIKMSKRKICKMNTSNLFVKHYVQVKKKNNKFFFLCGIYLIYILQFLKKNILYRFIDKIIYVLEKIAKNVYVNSCIINIYLHMLQLITPNNILYKNTNNTNISLNDKDIYIYIEKATIYTESINSIINNNSVLLKLNNFNIENIILSLLPYLLYFNNKKEEINAHIASINSECLHIISNIYYKSIYMYINSPRKDIKMDPTLFPNCDDKHSNNQCKQYKNNTLFEKIIELKKMYIFLLTCFVLSLACSFSSKRTRSEAYIKLQQFLFNENYIFKKVKKNEELTNINNKNERNSKHEKFVYRDEKLIDLISNFIILPLITYNYYFPFICKNIYPHKSKEGNEQYRGHQVSESDKTTTQSVKNNYCKEALLNLNLHNKKNNDISDKMWTKNEYENCGCIINYKNIETVNPDLNVLNNLFNYANDYYIHTMLHKQYNYYFSYLYAKKMLTYDNVCYRKSMSISFVSHIILSFLYTLLNNSGDACDNTNTSKPDCNDESSSAKGREENKGGKKEKNSHSQNGEAKSEHAKGEKGAEDAEEGEDINLYELLCLNNETVCNKIVAKTKCESNCIYYFLKHFYHALLTIKEEAQKIINIYKETFVENIKNIIYVSSSYAYTLKDHRINCFSHIKDGYSFLSEEEKSCLKPYNVENAKNAQNTENTENTEVTENTEITENTENTENAENKRNGQQEMDRDIFKSISKLQVNVRISMVLVFHVLYADNNQNDQFKNVFEELLNVLLTKYSDKPETQEDDIINCASETKTENEKEQNRSGDLANGHEQGTEGIAQKEGEKTNGHSDDAKAGNETKPNEHEVK
ncbi:protein transport protein SEC7, putative [Plasmodium ovale]|uniref:Protein transport protein SEC7, putative n=1 Tax=Plasmodium ovale TaxID=36330 RepID=A0A1C3KWD0_PLAOA|nr:protein transport protein SEC7, putative [Plasmodium ovale]